MLIRGVSVAALSLGLLWWWAVLRLVMAPTEAGVLEGAVAAGGWGLSLLPVHCVAKERAERVAAWSWKPAVATRIWRRFRSGGGAGVGPVADDGASDTRP